MIFPCREFMPVIRSALARGQRVRMTVNGHSMAPFIHAGDLVEIEPIRALPRRGDVVLLRCSEERYVVHRVMRMEGDAIFLCGDAQRHCEGPFTQRDVLGRVTLSQRNGHTRAHDRGAWRLAGLAWTSCGPLGRWLLWLAAGVRARGKRLLRQLRQALFFRA